MSISARRQPAPLVSIAIVVLLVLIGLVMVIGLAIKIKHERKAKADYMRACIVAEREDRCEELWRWRLPEMN